nr:hypothetical protein Iba_chr10eCG12820 [Ipomoea batatas]
MTATQATFVARLIERYSGYFEDLECLIPRCSSISVIDYAHACRLLGSAAETQEACQRPITNPPEGGFVGIHYQSVLCGFQVTGKEFHFFTGILKFQLKLEFRIN